MDKDTIKGKAKDVAGRVERQVGEWTGDEEHQVKGAAKQAEGKLQNAFGKTKEALREDSDRNANDEETREDEKGRKTA